MKLATEGRVRARKSHQLHDAIQCDHLLVYQNVFVSAMRTLVESLYAVVAVYMDCIAEQ